ncbi:unnamed protein product [Parascedosporium putredinis]|uniref:Uncharacterized protein n=1 Tax=Parascedosporium putredinis TaxID=1442378 RepID=A0A9P1MFP8_9PEZI|nr:unnamed protein product [Parascedosporium putredinis]CAI8002862.1 unnamed protein product [Parascedosporium putredinis]
MYATHPAFQYNRQDTARDGVTSFLRGISKPHPPPPFPPLLFPGGTSPSKVMPGYTGPSNGIMPSTGTPASPPAGVIKTGACAGLFLRRLLSLSLSLSRPAYGGGLRRAVLAMVLLIILCLALRRRLLQAAAVAPQLAFGHRRARAQAQARWRRCPPRAAAAAAAAAVVAVVVCGRAGPRLQ